MSLTALRTLAGSGAQHNAPPCLLQVLLGLVRRTGAAEVLWNRLYEPWCLARDAEVELALTGRCQLAQEQFLPYHRQPAAAAAAAGAQPGKWPFEHSMAACCTSRGRWRQISKMSPAGTAATAAACFFLSRCAFAAAGCLVE